MAYVTLAQVKAHYQMPGILFSGSGLNDMTVSGLTMKTPALTYVVKVSTASTTDKFDWSDDGGVTWDATAVSMTAAAQHLNNGVYVTFAAKTGHTATDQWTFITTELRDDAAMSDCITQAQADFEGETHRVFECSEDTTRYFDCAPPDVRGDTLYLDEDLCDIEEITNGDSDVLTATQYVTVPRNDTPYNAIQLRSDSGLAWTYSTHWENAITVEGHWAYSDSAPQRVVDAVRTLAKYYFDSRRAVGGVLSIASETSIRLLDSWPISVQQAVRKYRRLW